MSAVPQETLGQKGFKEGKRGKVVRKYATALAGQGLLSLFHFGLNIVLVREFVPQDYGIFALAFVAAVLGASLTAALAGTPVSVYTPGVSQWAKRRFLETLLSTVNLALVGGVLLITLLVTLWLHFPLATMLGFSVFVASYAARQYSRSFAFARQSPQTALYADITYVLSALLVLLLGGMQGSKLNLALVLAALALGNLAAIFLEFRLLAAGRVRIIRRWRSLGRYGVIWQQSRWALIGAVTTLIAAQAHSFIVTLFSGAAAYAPLAAGFVLFGPIRIGLQSWLSVMRPELAVAIARHDRASLHRIQTTSAWVMLLGVLLFALFLQLLWSPINEFLYANRYGDVPMGWIVAAWCAVTFFTAQVVTPSGMLQALKRFRVLAMGTVYSAMLSIAAVTIFLAVWGPAYSVLGILVAEAFLAGYLMIAVRREVQGN